MIQNFYFNRVVIELKSENNKYFCMMGYKLLTSSTLIRVAILKCAKFYKGMTLFKYRVFSVCIWVLSFWCVSCISNVKELAAETFVRIVLV